MPAAIPPSGKTECLNPNTGGRIYIHAATYDLFANAIHHTLKKGQPLTYTQIVEGVKDCFREQKTVFDGSVGWYTITVKNDLQSKGVIDVFTQKGKKMHRLADLSSVRKKKEPLK